MRFLLYGLSAVSRKIKARWFSFLNRIRLLLGGAKLGQEIAFSGPINLVFYWTASLSIGSFTQINSGFSVNPVGGYRKTGFYLGPQASLTIGESVGISNTTIVCLERVEIQDRVFIGGGSQIYDTDFHSLDASLRGTRLDRPVNLPVIIEEGSFVGGHCIVLKGVTIGKGAVIGAGSVVTKSVPAGELWAGNPARFIRKLTEQDVEPGQA